MPVLFLRGVRVVAFIFAFGCANSFAQTSSEIREAPLQDATMPADVQPKLPQLMSLAQALELADTTHPALLRQHAALLESEAEARAAGLDKRWAATLFIGARAADLLNDGDKLKNDSRAQLRVNKLLWDFGLSDAEQEVANLSVRGSRAGLAYTKRLQRIEIMRQYFAVLAADFQFLADNEAMSLAFFPFDRAQERSERFGSVSELEVMEKRVVYFEELTRRNQTLRRQRSSRFKLALAMGRPDAKPIELIEPDLSTYDRELPDFDDLLEKVIAINPLIRQKQLELEVLEAKESLVGASEKPSVSLELLATEYEQSHRLRDRTRATISLEIPLLTGRATASDQAGLYAEIEAKRAEMLMLDYEIREQVLAWVQSLEFLGQEIEQNAQNLEFRERSLDKNRLLYEMEVSAIIGRAQADMVKLIAQDAKDRFERVIIWEQIDAVLDKPVIEFN